MPLYSCLCANALQMESNFIMKSFIFHSAHERDIILFFSQLFNFKSILKFKIFQLLFDNTCSCSLCSAQQIISLQYFRLIGSYIRSWERPCDLPRVIEILCLFASGAHVSTYFFRKPTTFTIANSQRSPPLISN